MNGYLTVCEEMTDVKLNCKSYIAKYLKPFVQTYEL